MRQAPNWESGVRVWVSGARADVKCENFGRRPYLDDSVTVLGNSKPLKTL